MKPLGPGVIFIPAEAIPEVSKEIGRIRKHYAAYIKDYHRPAELSFETVFPRLDQLFAGIDVLHIEREKELIRHAILESTDQGHSGPRRPGDGPIR